MMNRLPWDIYESAMLLEAYLEIEKRPVLRARILKRLSDTLRTRAIEKGIKIDAVFRNFNGMNLQYERIRYLMTEGKRGFKGPVPKSFEEVKELYEKDRTAFLKLLGDIVVEKVEEDLSPKAGEEAKAPGAGEETPKEECETTQMVPKEEKAETPPPSPRLPWDRWEWALLLDAYEEIEKRPTEKTAILQSLSKALRTRAMNKGIEINETFRNLNGMKIQYEQVHYVMTNGAHGLKANLPKVFNEIKDIYDSDKNWFGLILRKAKKEAGIDAMVEKKSSPITVVDGARIDPAQVPLPEISLRGILSRDLFRNVYALELSLDLRQKLYHERVHTLQELADYMKDEKWGLLSSSEQSEIREKLGRYLDEHRSTRIVAARPVPETKPQEQAPAVESPFLGVMSQSSIPKYVWIENINTLSVPLAMKMDMYEKGVRTMGKLFTYLKNHEGVPYREKWEEALSGYLQPFLKDTNPEPVIVKKKEPTKKPIEEVKETPAVTIRHSYPTPLTPSVKVAEAPPPPREELKPVVRMPHKASYITDLVEAKNYGEDTPVAFHCHGRRFQAEGWSELYSKSLTYLLSKYSGIFKTLAVKSLYMDKDMWLVKKSEQRRLKKSADLGQGFYAEMDLTPEEMQRYLQKALQSCEIGPETFRMEMYHPEMVETIASRRDTSINEPKEDAALIRKKIPIREELPFADPQPDSLAMQIHTVLSTHFKDGFIPKRLFAKKFQGFFVDTYGHPAPIELEALIEEIRKVGEMRGDGRIYAKAGAEERSILQEVAQDLAALFDGGAVAVDRDTFYEKYREDLAKLSIHTASAMEAELRKRLSRRCSCTHGVYRRESQRDDGAEIVDFIKASPYPVPDTELLSKFWYLPKEKIDRILNSEKEILHQKNTRFYYANLSMTPEEREKLREKLYQAIWEKIYLSDEDILSILAEDFPGMAADVATFPPPVVRYSLSMLYPDDFCIVGGNLSDKEHQGSAGDALQSLCRRYTHLTDNELAQMREKINFKGNYASVVMEEMVRISAGEWKRRDQVHFDRTIPRYIARFMERKECIPIRDVTGFLEFPDVGEKWNLYVLESYLYKNDGPCPFRLLQTPGGVSAGGVYGIIAKRGGRISTYESALIYLLAGDSTWETDAEALEWIVDRGLQATKRLKDIPSIAKAARAERKLRQSQNE